MEENNLLLTEAINKHNMDSWRNFRISRNLTNKIISKKNRTILKINFLAQMTGGE